MTKIPRVLGESQLKKFTKPMCMIISFWDKRLEYLAHGEDGYYWTFSRDCACEVDGDTDLTDILCPAIMEPWREISLIKGHFEVTEAYDLNAAYEERAAKEIEEIDARIEQLKQQRETLLNR